jgi:hypothetical protein
MEATRCAGRRDCFLTGAVAYMLALLRHAAPEDMGAVPVRRHALDLAQRHVVIVVKLGELRESRSDLHSCSTPILLMMLQR